MSTRTGKLIVIEGTDGTGKTTQARLLIEFLTSRDIPHGYLDFPQYDTFYGKLIARFLRGEFGSIETVSPYLAAVLFALDRAAIRHKMEEHLNQGVLLIVNRYVESNIAHQGSKIADVTKRNEFIRWVQTLEYEINKLPKPDITIYLDLPTLVARDLAKQKGERAYLQGMTDIQEDDHSHQQATQAVYTALSNQSPNWEVVECVKNGTIRSKDDIHHDIVKILEEKNII